MLSLFSPLLIFTASAVALTTRAGYKCAEAIVPVHVRAQSIGLDVDAPRDQAELTGLVTRLTSQTNNFTEVYTGRTEEVDAEYNIWTQLCIPKGFKETDVLEFAVHGIQFDHSYWTFGGPDSDYNYVEAALKAGHATFIYDRLGTGLSDKPEDGIREVQRPVQIEIAAELLRCLRKGDHGLKFNNIIGVGNGFGSSQLAGVAELYEDLLDALVLTSFTSYSAEDIPTNYAALGIALADLRYPERFGDLSSSYLVTEGIINDQHVLFRYPNFEYEVLEFYETIKSTFTLGEILTFPTYRPAERYTKPVFIVTGDKDFAFCGGNCYQAIDGTRNLLELTKNLFPATQDFDTYIIADTGRAINLHNSAPETFRVIQEYIELVASKRLDRADGSSHRA